MILRCAGSSVFRKPRTDSFITPEMLYLAVPCACANFAAIYIMI